MILGAKMQIKGSDNEYHLEHGIQSPLLNRQIAAHTIYDIIY